ncbi:MAG TPA: hypothetical protein VJ739_18310 [Gemmataceae bacterium]|nr:hypothetical protein [Gemmataceae bacterium]
MPACVIRVERGEDGRYRATCTLFPGHEAQGPTEEAARRAMEDAVRRYLQNGERPESAAEPT